MRFHKIQYLYESPQLYSDVLKVALKKEYISNSEYQNYKNKIFETPNLKLFIKLFQ